MGGLHLKITCSSDSISNKMKRSMGGGGGTAYKIARAIYVLRVPLFLNLPPIIRQTLSYSWGRRGGGGGGGGGAIHCTV